ncbi:hypothetical protein BCR33DRAFT_724786 [Rhizoclosmatium globosum]|uniref:Uncharacterized protein n=1 Tax=Rhizoclosmatium globosum TaxID=329046 RepID=A0A1Y2B3H4_9FUNG|nr:hypothetical protein BCR33DRAFT_724786 [Rhizoclosmatium globosum]|eukprot:ORY29276.1 hypothetical protein BCR33DRAFT_724786 [Rhizoclosmatium globosum]
MPFDHNSRDPSCNSDYIVTSQLQSMATSLPTNVNESTDSNSLEEKSRVFVETSLFTTTGNVVILKQGRRMKSVEQLILSMDNVVSLDSTVQKVQSFGDLNAKYNSTYFGPKDPNSLF